MKHPISAALFVFWTIWFIWGYSHGADSRTLIYRGFFATAMLIAAH